MTERGISLASKAAAVCGFCVFFKAEADFATPRREVDRFMDVGKSLLQGSVDPMTSSSSSSQRILDLMDSIWKCALEGNSVAYLLDELQEEYNCHDESVSFWTETSLVKVFAVAASQGLLDKNSWLQSSQLDIVKSMTTVSHWTAVLLDYFATKKQSPYPTVDLRRHLDGQSVGNWTDQEPWRMHSVLRDAVLYCLQCTSAISQMSDLSKTIPFLLALAEDWDPSIRSLGVQCIVACLHCTDRCLMESMRVHLLFKEALMKNLSFNDHDLKIVSIDCLVEHLLPWNRQWVPVVLDQLLRDCVFSSDKVDLVKRLIPAIVDCIDLLGLEAVCHLNRLVPLAVDILDHQLRIMLLCSIYRNCLPRLHRHAALLQQAIADVPETDCIELVRLKSYLDQL